MYSLSGNSPVLSVCSRFVDLFFSVSVFDWLQDKTNTVIDLYKDMLRNVEDLGTCPYTPEAFSELLGRVQGAIDRLNLEGYANLEMWVSELDRRIEGVLLARLDAIIRVWCAAFEDDEDKETHHKDIKGRSRFKAKDKDKVSFHSLSYVRRADPSYSMSCPLNP